MLLFVTGQLGKHFRVHIHVGLEEGAFRLNRFHISKNNVRPQWYHGNDAGDGKYDFGACCDEIGRHEIPLMATNCDELSVITFSRRGFTIKMAGQTRVED